MLWKATIRLPPDVVESIQEKAARTACRIEHKKFALRIEHFDSECYEFARGEILSEITLEESAHEFFERDALCIEFRTLEGNTF